MASAALKQSEETSVPMVFYHALSKITFTISTYENSGLNVQVNSISVNNIPLTGDFTMVPTATTASDYFTVSIPSTASSTDSATITPSTAISLPAGDATVTSSVIAGLYLIPRTLDN